jgi:hypothetical protein
VVDGCEYPRWAKGLCKRHQFLRTDRRPKALKKISEKGKVKKELKKALYPTDMAFYLTIWMERPHKCYNCDKDLGLKPYTYYFDHILEKGADKYKHLRYEKNNICLLCIDCHTNKAIIPRLMELREDTKKALL